MIPSSTVFLDFKILNKELAILVTSLSFSGPNEDIYDG